VHNFGSISKPLTNLLKKVVLFLWTEAEESSFQALKIAFTTVLVLALPNLHKSFIIETDALDKGIRAVL
jgi:hypothetical protein